MTRPLKILLAGVLVALCAAVWASCGEEDDPPAAAGAGEITTVRVGVLPVGDVAPLFLGVEKGFFHAEDLKIEPQFADGGAAIVPAVMSGDLDIGFSNVTSLAIAASELLPVRIIAHGAAAGTDADDAPDALMVREDSDIRTARDLEGKTVAVNALNNVSTLATNRALERSGVDYRDVEYTEVPYPEIPAAVAAGRVDAAFVVEPFVTDIKRAGGRAILHPMERTERNYTIATYFASERFIEGEPDVLERFVRAVKRSNLYAQRHPDEVRRAVPGYTKTPPETTRVMNLTRWERQLDEPSIELTARLAERYGYLDEAPAIDELVWDGARLDRGPGPAGRDPAVRHAPALLRRLPRSRALLVLRPRLSGGPRQPSIQQWEARPAVPARHRATRSRVGARGWSASRQPRRGLLDIDGSRGRRRDRALHEAGPGVPRRLGMEPSPLRFAHHMGGQKGKVDRSDVQDPVDGEDHPARD
jgi:NitT/TauT family transport system substrate-binding protein